MKRFVVILLLVSILLGLSGCKDRFGILQVGSIDLDDTLNCNYNNAIAGNSKFWIADRSVYYAYNALIYGGYVRSSSDGREKILSFWEPVANQIIVRNGELFMLDCYGPGIFKLHYYEPTSGTDTSLGMKEGVWSYFPLDEYVYYLLSHHEDGGRYGQPFGVCSLADGTSTIIEEYVFAAGVMGDSPVYVTEDGGEFEIFAYQPLSGLKEQIGSFSFPISEEEGFDYYANFTSSQVIFTVFGEDNAAKLLCYDVVDHQLSVHQLPGDDAGLVCSVIAYEDYAFAIRESNTTSSNEVYTSTIYRINLRTGETTTITSDKGSVNSFVTSDEYIYVISDENMKGIYRYDSSGNRELAFKL